MSTGIEWTDETWSVVTGCTKVSQGCKHCYAERVWHRLSAKGMPYEGRAFTDVQCHPERLEQPHHWRKPRRVFVNSMSDLFHEDVPVEVILRIFAVMADTPRHTYQILTKRPERMRDFMRWWLRYQRSALRYQDGNESPPGTFKPLPNVQLMVSAENQETAEERISLLLQTPAAVRGVSLEPLLGPIDLRQIPIPGIASDGLLFPLSGEFVCDGRNEPLPIKGGGIDWVVVGGESGPKARPMHPDWVRSLRHQCVEAGVPFFFKQWGEWSVTYDRDRDDPDWRRCPKSRNHNERYINLAGGFGFHGERVCFVRRVGKKAAGRELDGRTWDEYPQQD